METLVKQFSFKRFRKLSDDTFMNEIRVVLNEPLFQEKFLMESEIEIELTKQLLEKTGISLNKISVTKVQHKYMYPRQYRVLVTNPHTKNTFSFSESTTSLDF